MLASSWGYFYNNLQITGGKKHTHYAILFCSKTSKAQLWEYCSLGKSGFFFKSSLEDMLIDLRERESAQAHEREKHRCERETWKKGRKREKERNSNMKEKHGSVASLHIPHQGSNPQPKYVPWLGMEPTTFWCTGRHSNQLNLLARAQIRILNK